MTKFNFTEEYSLVRRLHQETFDALAGEYASRFEQRKPRELFLLGALSTYVRQTFRSSPILTVLDVGCGTGGSCAILNDEGFRTVGLDISREMLRYAKIISPETEYIHADFIEVDMQGRVFHAACAKAVLHLFDDIYATLFLKKVHSLLVPNGGLFIAVGGGPTQSGYASKDDYPGNLSRYRRTWTISELNSVLLDIGFLPVFWGEQQEENKDWIDCWAIKAQ